MGRSSFIYYFSLLIILKHSLVFADWVDPNEPFTKTKAKTDDTYDVWLLLKDIQMFLTKLGIIISIFKGLQKCGINVFRMANHAVNRFRYRQDLTEAERTDLAHLLNIESRNDLG